jgi:TrmH family RNA methyltransferase
MLSALQPRIRIVQSPSNQWVKALRHAVAHPPTLPFSSSAGALEQPLVALEGPHLVAEALAAGLAPAALFLGHEDSASTIDLLSRALGAPARNVLPLLDGTEILALPQTLFRNIAGTEAPQPIAALIRAPSPPADALLSAGAPLLLVLCGLQDPGNVGTLLRSGLAFGATAAVLLTGTASPWNGKAMRASAGAALRLPLVAMRDAAQLAQQLSLQGIRSYAAVPAGGQLVDEQPLARPSAFWIGNEGLGLADAELAACDARVTLRMAAVSESLNAAVAGSLLLYEAARQRAAEASKLGGFEI